MSNGALSLRPSSSATATPLSPRSTLATRDFHMEPDVLARLRALVKRRAKMAILVHEAERLVIVGIEM